MIPTQRTHYPIQKDWGIPELPLPYQEVLAADGSGTVVTYIGYAPITAKETDLSWLVIRKTVTTAGVTKYEYPNSSMEFVQAWSSRASLAYSRG